MRCYEVRQVRSSNYKGQTLSAGQGEAREQVEWVLLKWGVSIRNMFDDLVIVLLVEGGRERMETR